MMSHGSLLQLINCLLESIICRMCNTFEIIWKKANNIFWIFGRIHGKLTFGKNHQNLTICNNQIKLIYKQNFALLVFL